MKIEDLIQRVSITRDKAILLGKNLACDGFDSRCEIGVISHAHGDHTQGLHSSLHFYGSILTSPETRDLLIADEGRSLQRWRNLIPQPYRKPFKYNDERITLYPATHILGSVKTLLEQADGTRILYTGDFRMPQRPIRANVIVIEATYGDPKMRRFYGKEFVVRQLIRLVRQEIKKGPIQIHATRGKLQEIMESLTNVDVHVPFLMPRKTCGWAMVYKQYGKNVGECLPLGTGEALEIQRSEGPYILFYTLGSKMLDFRKYFCLKISGREPQIPYKEVTKNYHVLTISDHADLKELLVFIKRTRAKLVFIDGTRDGDAPKLAREIKRRLGIEAVPQPLSYK